jgi:predicted AlkP superfamily phosphohydrolase/phosphomutase
VINSHSVRAPMFWELAGRRGKRVTLVDMPITYPPRPVNGYLVAGMGTPTEDCVWTHPPSLQTELLLRVGDLPLEGMVVRAHDEGGPLETIKAVEAFTQNRLAVALYLMEKGDWDLLAVVFRGTDMLQHVMWRYMDDELRHHHPELSRKLGQVIAQYYERMDRAVGTLLEAAGPGVTTIVLSDHGMGPCRRHFFLNRWLEEEGFLRRKALSAWRARRPRVRVGRPLSVLPAARGKGRVGRFLRSVRLPYPAFEYLGRPAEVDWGRTRAYANWTGGEAMISLNVRGREPQGIVPPGSEYEAVRKEIRARLLALRDPRDGQPVVEKVYLREEIYHGPHVAEAPDLHLIPRDFAYHARGEVRAPSVITAATDHAPSLHDVDGIVVAAGEGIRPGHRLEGAAIIDLAPTVLHLMGLPVPEDMDGKVLAEALEPAFLAAHPIRSEPASPWTLEEPAGLTRDEEGAIIETLRGLGYVT